ncbi:MAG: hypothetical protein H0X54_09055 [Propionibacteriales bacterium]|nr:hypothetical protein [Propionibacteriales bacterium]
MRRLTTRYVSRTRRFSEAVDSGLNRTRLDSTLTIVGAAVADRAFVLRPP